MNILRLGAVFGLFLVAGLSAAANNDVKKHGKIVVEQLLSPSPTVKQMGAEAYFKASPEQLKSIRKQFRHATGGRFLEPFLMSKDDVRQIMNEHILSTLGKSGDEKVYACSLLTYMVSRRYERFERITPDLLSTMLAKTLMEEVTLPSLVPILLDAGADPYKPCPTTQKKSLIPMQIAFSRLKQRKNVSLISNNIRLMLAQTFVDPEIAQSAHVMRAGFSVWKDTPQMDMVRALVMRRLKKNPGDADLIAELDRIISLQKFNATNQHWMGVCGEKFTAKEYEESFPVWLDICSLLGADIKMLRKCVFSLLKTSPDNRFDFETVKFLRSGELNAFHKFALACVVDEFLFCVASSLHGRHVYNFDVYRIFGELEPVVRDAVEAHRCNAERCRRKLSIEAHKRVAYFCGDGDSDEEPDQVGAETSSQPSSPSC